MLGSAGSTGGSREVGGLSSSLSLLKAQDLSLEGGYTKALFLRGHPHPQVAENIIRGGVI